MGKKFNFLTLNLVREKCQSTKTSETHESWNI